jgi:LEA14-like dessication related protein
MKGKNLLLLAGAGALALIMLSRKKQIAKSAQYSFEKIGVNLARRKVIVTLGILNPAQGSIRINSVVGLLRINGRDVATVENFTPVTVAGNAKSMLPLTLTPSLSGITDLIRSYIQMRKDKKKSPAKVTFAGSSNVDGMTLPIQTTLL